MFFATYILTFFKQPQIGYNAGQQKLFTKTLYWN